MEEETDPREGFPYFFVGTFIEGPRRTEHPAARY